VGATEQRLDGRRAFLDGRYVAIAASGTGANMWMMENF